MMLFEEWFFDNHKVFREGESTSWYKCKAAWVASADNFSKIHKDKLSSHDIATNYLEKFIASSGNTNDAPVYVDAKEILKLLKDGYL